MDKLTAILILVCVWGFVVLEFIFIISWFRKHKYLLQFSKKDGNTLILKSGRYRRINSNFYSITDIFKRKPFAHNVINRDHYIVTESTPIIGVQYTIKIINNSSWQPVKIDDTPLINNILIGWLHTTRKELYESTKSEVSRGELLAKIILPIGLIILAMACLIFFPKIYESILTNGNAVANTALSQFSETVNKIVPIG